MAYFVYVQGLKGIEAQKWFVEHVDHRGKTKTYLARWEITVEELRWSWPLLRQKYPPPNLPT